MTPDSVPKPGCSGCQQLVKSMQDVVKSANQTYQEQCIDYLDVNMCGKLPADVQDNCKSVVGEQIPEIWEEIINDYLNPNATCSKIGLCSSLENAVDPDPKCALCKKAAKWLDKNIFENPDEEAKVAEQLKAICAKLADKGKDIEQKCEEMVDDDAADMMASIGQAIAKQLCIDVGACSGPSPPPPPPSKK